MYSQNIHHAKHITGYTKNEFQENLSEHITELDKDGRTIIDIKYQHVYSMREDLSINIYSAIILHS